MTATVAEIATLVHGYTLADVERLARSASRKYSQWNMANRQETYESAWHAIVVKLYDSEEPPEEKEVYFAAVDLLRTEYRDRAHHHGRNVETLEVGPRFTAYWSHHASADDDFTERLCERMALPQVLAVLTPSQYEAVIALAATDSQKAAAELLGIKKTAFEQRLASARKRVAEAWYAPETARQNTKRADLDKWCRYGHLRAEHSYITPAGIWSCRLCSRNQSRRRNAKGESTFKKAAAERQVEVLKGVDL